jgi:hypothetical protein
MATLKIDKQGPQLFGFDLLRPDGTSSRIGFKADGPAEIVLNVVGQYALDWVVRGAEGSEFSYKVSLDDTVVEELPRTKISSAQSEVGHISFEVKS